MDPLLLLHLLLAVSVAFVRAVLHHHLAVRQDHHHHQAGGLHRPAEVHRQVEHEGGSTERPSTYNHQDRDLNHLLERRS